MNDPRITLLNQLANSVSQSAASGWLDGKPIAIVGSPQTIAGPRAGAVEFGAGFDAGRLLASLQKNDCAVLRQMIPWSFPGEPSVYLTSRFVRVEAPWNDDLAQRDIRLNDLATNPKNGHRWIAGINERGSTVTLGLSDDTPHFLIAGWTGSGKTEAMRAALVQLSRDPQNQIVMVDGKYGAGLKVLEHLSGVVGPCAVDVEQGRKAIAWAVNEMQRRYQMDKKDCQGHIIVAVDEIQEYTGKNGDDLLIALIGKLVRQGREVNVHCLIGTQHPTLDALTDSSIKRNFTARIALKVADAKASEVAIGASAPRADWLCGGGDSYVVTARACHRVQIAHLPVADIVRYATSTPRLEDWPEIETVPDTPEKSERTKDSGTDLALALLAAGKGSKRVALGTMFEKAGFPRPGSDRLDRLVTIGREQLTALKQLEDAHGWKL